MSDTGIVKLLDDFLFITKSVEEGRKTMDVFRQVCAQIGIPLAERKSMGPA